MYHLMEESVGLPTLRRDSFSFQRILAILFDAKTEPDVFGLPARTM